MYNFYRSYDFDPANILAWTSTDGDNIELPYKTDQFRLDARELFAAEIMPYDGDTDNETAIDAYCQAVDTAFDACTISVQLMLDFISEEPAAAFIVTITAPSGDAWEIIGNTDISAESAAEIIVEFLRHGAAGVAQETATGYRYGMALYYLIRRVNGEPVPADEISSLLSELQSVGASPQQITDRLTA